MPKISVIIPVFGVEKYIERCARSLFEQTLDEMEYIFVDDCCKDNSFEVLERVIKDYPSRENQIKIVRHEINRGLSYARETGIKNATGDYIGHCDSDDWVAPTMYEKLYDKAILGNYDYVKCGHYLSNGNDVIRSVSVSFHDGIDKARIIALLLRCTGINSVWDSITRRSVYLKNKYTFTDKAMLEDFFLSAQTIEYSNSYGVVQEPLYYYFQNPNSICNIPSREAFIKRGMQAKCNADWILGFIHERYGDKYQSDEVILKYIPRRTIIPIMVDSKNYPFWDSFYPDNTLKLMLSPYLACKLKFQYLLVEFHLYSYYKKIMK